MAIDPRDTVEIPQPRGLPIVGNLLELLSAEVPIETFANLGRQYGEIFSITVFGVKIIFVSSHAILNELCDEKRFEKEIGRGLMELRLGVHDGLFTAHNHEENWHIAHRVLVPAFGPLNIHEMFDSMKDIASQLVLKWARHGSSYRISATDDFTRLTLDTLALCAMDYRFNSFYTQELHPFIASMTNFLKYAEGRAKRHPMLHAFYRRDEQKWREDIEYMRNFSAEIVQGRIRNPQDTKDLLNAMILGKDPKTGKGLTDDSIIDNMITFLIAGHETTSGMLSFIFYYLLKNPEAYRKAQQEVDEVVGSNPVTPEHINKLPYITAILRESSRLQATAPGFVLTPKNPQGEVIAGKYHVKKGEPIINLLHNIHRDPAVYGDDAEEFRPERMLDENFDKLPPNAWKPFGNGARGCIGRPFAWQEMLITMTLLLQYFNFEPDDPSYDLRISAQLTIKPKDFFMRAKLREGWTPSKVEQSLFGATRGSTTNHHEKQSEISQSQKGAEKKGKPLTILYGSNSGTCESLAQSLAADAVCHGFEVSKVSTLDSARQALPSDQPVVMVTASYEGQPCDNGAHFFHWLEQMPPDAKINSQFAVFGCGHSDWKQTFHRVPTAIDRMLFEHGAQRLCEIGLANAAKGDMMSDFQTWEDEVLWPALKKQFATEDDDDSTATSSPGQSVSIEVFSKRASQLRSDVSEAKIISSKTISNPGVGKKNHIELQLPSDMTYRAGDYLAVLPLNPDETVHRVMTRFSLPWDAMLQISSRTGTTLPTDHPISAQNLFSAYVELSQPATKRGITMLQEASSDQETKSALSAIIDGDFHSEIIAKRVSLLDLLERFPSLQLPLGAFVGSLIPMRVRQYSISSSPLADPHRATLTWSVLDAPSLSGQGRHVGVASNYLAQLQPGDIIHVAVKASHYAFHLPSDGENTPIVMIAAGSGIAPFRGFIQERAAQLGAGRKLAPAHLYFGTHHPAQDDLFREDLDFWERMGAVVVHRAFSRAPEQSSLSGARHVNELLVADGGLLEELWARGAKVFVCGSRELGESVKAACLQVAGDAARRKGRDDSDEVLQKWFDSVRNDRYSTDVFD